MMGSGGEGQEGERRRKEGEREGGKGDMSRY